eukprot:753682-Hanusia_phi.AAC.2
MGFAFCLSTWLDALCTIASFLSLSCLCVFKVHDTVGDKALVVDALDSGAFPVGSDLSTWRDDLMPTSLVLLAFASMMLVGSDSGLSDFALIESTRIAPSIRSHHSCGHVEGSSHQHRAKP